MAKFVEENAEKIPEAERTELTTKNDELKKVLDDETAEASALTAASDAVMEVYQRVGQAMVQNQQAQAPEGEAGSAAGEPEADTEDDVVEGEIVDEGEAS